jgi:hypothetical protein
VVEYFRVFGHVGFFLARDKLQARNHLMWNWIVYCYCFVAVVCGGAWRAAKRVVKH